MAIFATADDKYVPACTMALRSFQRWFPDCSYFLLGTRAAMSQRSIALLERYKIELIDVDLAHRFRRSACCDNGNAVERFYLFSGPELLWAKGYRYSLSVDGDVFCSRPFDLQALCDGVEGFRGRAIGTLARTLRNKQRQQHQKFDFEDWRVRDVLGMDENHCRSRWEVNSGVLVWNNMAMARHRLAEQAARVFDACGRCFCGDQELLAFTAAACGLPFTEMDDTFNFRFFEGAAQPDPRLIEQMRRGECNRIRIVHFVFSKPWCPVRAPSAVKAHFINAWRVFVLDELGNEGQAFFDDLSHVRVRFPIGFSWNIARKIRSRLRQ